MMNNTKKTLAYYWQATLNYKAGSILVVLTVIGAATIEVIFPLYYKQFFDLLAGGGEKDAIVAGLIHILYSIVWLTLASWICWRTSTFTAAHVSSKIMTDLTNQCFRYLHRHSFSFFNNNFVGSLVKRVKWFTNAFEAISDRLIWDFLPLIVNLIVIGIVLFQRNIWLGFGVFGWLTIFLSINWVFTRYKLKYDILRNAKETESTGLLADTVTNNSNVKLFNGYDREVKGFAKVAEELRRLRKKTWNLGNAFEAVQGFLTSVLEIGILYLAIRLWQRGELTIGDFVLIQAYLAQIFMRVWSFGRVIRDIYERLADADEMTAILVTPHEIQDALGAKNLKVKTGKIEFQNVSFGYHANRQILSNFNLIIKPTERIALIGPSGAGKTTVIKLLLRTHDLTKGKILIDNQDIAKVTQESLWANVSLVPQDPILFHRTLMENIRYGNPKASEEEILAASRAAHCHEFITSLPEGYNTYVGERGIKLSGGERQRVAIARAILHHAPILVLDEATSSLDSESELLIQDALSKLMADKVVIVIAHRLSTIRKMDRIIVVDQGKIVEEGTHQELVDKEVSIYKKLWELQAGGFIK